MWNRKELKAKAKAAFQANYWRSVLVAFIIFAIIGGGAASSGNSVKNDWEEAQETLTETQSAAFADLDNEDMTPEQLKEEILASLEESGVTAAQLAPFLVILGAVVFVIATAGVVIDIFLLNPLSVGTANFFAANTREKANLDTLKRGFTPHWLHNVGTLFLRDLFLALWAMLFVIPAVVKSYAYRMVPYIMAEHPDMSGTEAITLSRQMMKGNKWAAFVFDLSFLGWELLSGITAGILGVFWVRPYKAAANAELYRAVSAGYFDGEAEYVDAEIVYEP